MLKIIAAGKRNASVSFPFNFRSAAVGNLLFLPLFAGILLGCVFAVYTQFDPIALHSFFSVGCSVEKTTFPSALFSTGKYFFLVILSGTSYLGIFFLPSLVFVRGCSLGSAVASFYAALGFRGLLNALLLCGVTELLTLPAMMLLTEHSFYSAHSLLRLRTGKWVIRDNQLHPRQLLISIVFSVTLAIVYRCALLPLLYF